MLRAIPSIVYDVIIVGAGPAGLSAALVLGRCRRRVLVMDAGTPRNAASGGLHGFLTRDGIDPRELLRVGCEEIKRYGVELRGEAVTKAHRATAGFEVTSQAGDRLSCRKLLIATGVIDRIPTIPGIEEFYGRSVFHCQYCDGWEMRDSPLAALGVGRSAAGMAVSLLTWSSNVTLCTNGPPRLGPEESERLARNGIKVRSELIAALEGKEGRLEWIRFATGDVLVCRAAFFNTGQLQRSTLAHDLGCRLNAKGTIQTNRMQSGGIPGLYVAGDAARDVQFAVVAAAEGAKAAVAINTSLEQEDRP